jgi:hypothetical protein
MRCLLLRSLPQTGGKTGGGGRYSRLFYPLATTDGTCELTFLPLAAKMEFLGEDELF